MSSDRQVVPIGELGRVVTGKTPSTGKKDYFGGDIPFYTPSDMDGRKFLIQTERCLTRLGADSVKGSIIPAGSVMVSCIGSDMGKVAIAGIEGVSNQQINSIIVSPSFCHEYIYYELSARKKELKALSAGGSAQPILNKGQFSRVEVVAPDLPEQKAIAHILGTLDDKIELNRKTNETLEAIAKALFKSWFVDFDPVRAKAEGRLTGLPAEISDLFPDSFEDSELGEIPRGWSSSTLGNDFTISMGQSPPGETYNEQGIGLPFYQGRTDFGFRFPSKRVYCSAPTRIGEPGATLISVRAPVGSVNRAREVSAIGRGVASIYPKDKGFSFTYYLVQSLGKVFDAYNSEGTVFGAINRKDMAGIKIPSPPQIVKELFESIISSVDDRILTLSNQIESLTSTREVLLPKLISGELRIPDAEALVAEAGI